VKTDLRSVVCSNRLALTAALVLTWLLSTDPAKSEILNSNSRPYTGYTRPGAPDDRVEGGKIVWVANVDKGVLKNGLGGTIYFAIFDLASGTADDTWGTGIKGFNASFRPGLDFAGDSSPSLDTSARYLYLYQVVNDRGTETPVRSTVLKLSNAESLTSWGHFAGYSFALQGAVKDAQGKPVVFAGGEGGSLTYVAVGNKAVSGEHIPTPFQIQAPAVFDIRPRLTNFFGLTELNELVKKGNKFAGNVPLIEPLAVKGRDPNFVLIGRQLDFAVNAPSKEFGGPAVRASDGYAATFRAIWTEKNLLLREEMSPLYGFTSNLPPGIAPIRLQGWHKDAAGGEGGKAGKKVLPAPQKVPMPPDLGRRRSEQSVQLVSASDVLPQLGGRVIQSAREQAGQGTALEANGSALAPAGAGGAAAGGGIAGVGIVGTLGGTNAGGFGAPIGGLGGFGAARTPFLGGGFGGGTGTNQGTGTGTTSQAQQQQNQNQQPQPPNNQGNVVPEPHAYLLLLLGLPVLLLFRRRKFNPTPSAN
jgi:hypothetical protein